MANVCHFENNRKTAAIVGLLDCSSLKSEVKVQDSSGRKKRKLEIGVK